MPLRCLVALGGRGGEWGGAVEAGEACFAGEASGVADLDEELGVGPRGDAAQLAERGPGEGRETVELDGRPKK